MPAPGYTHRKPAAEFARQCAEEASLEVVVAGQFDRARLTRSERERLRGLLAALYGDLSVDALRVRDDDREREWATQPIFVASIGS